MRKILFVGIFWVLNVAGGFSQGKQPKLVVGIIVDQMRQEYLLRFRDRFGKDGFNKLVEEGYSFRNAHFNYVPTYTAPGHASVYTGSTPAIHGIIANEWYDKVTKEMRYCAEDTTVSTVGSSSLNGKMSPHSLLATTITDELRIFTHKQAKVVGVSLKDRGAIFPAGHLGEAYWFDTETGDFITSTYYMDTLPGWVQKFNSQRRADQFVSSIWEPMYDLGSYVSSDKDESTYEGLLAGSQSVFPYDLSKADDNYTILPYTPFGNDILMEMALAAIEGADLGRGKYTDFLAISFSSTDYVGHHFGPNALELEDTYLRLDRNLAQLIKTLDAKLGKDNYLLYLTADHGVAEVPQYLTDNKIPSGYFKENVKGKVTELLNDKYGNADWVESMSNLQVFLNHKAVEEKGLSLQEVQRVVSDYLMTLNGVAESYPAYVINWLDYNASGIKGLMARGYNQKRSGDVLFCLQPGWFRSWDNTGSTHHSAFTYDTHVPMLWYGAGIKHGESFKYHPTTDIAPTLSMILGIKLPSGATGQPILELLHE